MQQVGTSVLSDKKEYGVIELTSYLLLRCLLLISLAIALETSSLPRTDVFQILHVFIWIHIIYGLLNSAFIYQRNKMELGRFELWLDFVAVATVDLYGRHTLLDPWLSFFLLILLGALFHSNRKALLLTSAIVGLHVFMLLWGNAEQNGSSLKEKALIEIGFTAAGGLILAYWGRHRLLNIRRLSLLYRIVDDINIRLGPEHTIKTLACRLGLFFEAQSVVIVSIDKNQQTGTLTHVNISAPYEKSKPRVLRGEALKTFCSISTGMVGLFNDQESGPFFWQKNLSNWFWLDEKDASEAMNHNEVGDAVAQLFDVPSLITAEILNNDGLSQRIFIGAKLGKHYEKTDLLFIRQILLILRPYYNNVRLIFELMEDANRRERTRIYHDLHDRSIQPYIGLRMSLQALLRRLDPHSPAYAGVEDVLQYTNQSLTELRHFAVAFLNHEDINVRGLELLIHDLLKRYERHFGIHSQLRFDLPQEMPEMLLQEIFAIVSEGLSNVMRHSDAQQIELVIERKNEYVQVEILQETNKDKPLQLSDVAPKSIAMRIENLGGRMTIESLPHGLRLNCLIPF